MPLSFSYNQQVYKLSEHIVRLPVLIPGVMCAATATPTLLAYARMAAMSDVRLLFTAAIAFVLGRYKTEISCHAIAEGVADVIRVFVMAPNSVVPVITATVNMPLAEPM
eukprot:COSAG02_NODE_4563_length_5214_cov_17.431085_6_plen_109_part_00